MRSGSRTTCHTQGCPPRRSDRCPRTAHTQPWPCTTGMTPARGTAAPAASRSRRTRTGSPGTTRSRTSRPAHSAPAPSRTTHTRGPPCKRSDSRGPRSVRAPRRSGTRRAPASGWGARGRLRAQSGLSRCPRTGTTRTRLSRPTGPWHPRRLRRKPAARTPRRTPRRPRARSASPRKRPTRLPVPPPSPSHSRRARRWQTRTSHRLGPSCTWRNVCSSRTWREPARCHRRRRRRCCCHHHRRPQSSR
mmetsp:Transcript_27893/g.89981  ORF Transcript_27893/g.89981 Transcript_27893/m.89981 type:complete len:247 (+) Transcript_27893:1067-1807(+)